METNSVRKIISTAYYNPEMSDKLSIETITLYNVANNKKNSCFPMSQIGDKEYKPKCKNFNKPENCSRCIILKRNVRRNTDKMNRKLGL